MACAVSTLTATPRDVTCGEIGAVAKMAAANSRPMIDPALIAFLLMFSPYKDGRCLIKNSNPRASDTSIHPESEIESTLTWHYESRRVERSNQDQDTTKPKPNCASPFKRRTQVAAQLLRRRGAAWSNAPRLGPRQGCQRCAQSRTVDRPGRQDFMRGRLFVSRCMSETRP